VTDLNVSFLPWQQEVFADKTRFKVIPAGRRTGKSVFACWTLILEALDATEGKVFYVAPTQGQAREIMWDMLLEMSAPVRTGQHINNLEVTLVNGRKIALKGADRPETMRGIKLKYLVMDEYADMKVEVWEQILRPALADLKGNALFIGTPMGRNHFYELYKYAELGEDPEWAGWHYTSYDNPTLDPKEINAAKKSMSSFSFRQEFLASFEAMESELFKEDWIQFSEKEPDHGEYIIPVDLAGFADVQKITTKTKRLDETAIPIIKINEDGWWIKDIIVGRWGVKETARKIFEAVRENRPINIGIEKGALKNAVHPYLEDLMRQNQTFFRVHPLTHGNQKKVDRVIWGIQGRFEHGNITLNKGDWNAQFLDQLFQFPNPLVHDDMVDALAYGDQLAKVSYYTDHIPETYEGTQDILTGY
jgi:phage terminase large subunit-like protein